VVVVCALRVLVLVLVLLVVLLFFRGDLAVEVLDDTEVASAAARVELPRTERDLVVEVERVRRIFSEIRRQDHSAAAHLVPALSAFARHGGTGTRLELRYQPPPGRFASGHGTGRFSSEKQRASSTRTYRPTRGFLPDREPLAS
jgi:hypothetical protein